MFAELAIVLGLAAAFTCWLLLAAPELTAAWRWAGGAIPRLLRTSQVAVDLAQAELYWLAPRYWIASRWGLAVIAGVLAYLLFGLAVLGLVAALAAYHLAGVALEARRRQAEARRQRALLDAMRFGISMLSRSGGALHMLQALSQNGPIDAQPIFRDLLSDAGSDQEHLLLDAVRRARERLADPLMDDLAMALVLHFQHGGRLAPALDVLVADWNETLRLQREAQALRAGVEASVVVLTALPFVFLLLMHLMAPALLVPLSTPLGEVVLAVVVAWMVLGYRVLQRMSQAPREDRIPLNEAAL